MRAQSVSTAHTLFWMDTSILHPHGNAKAGKRPSPEVVSPNLGRSRVEAQLVQTNASSIGVHSDEKIDDIAKWTPATTRDVSPELGKASVYLVERTSRQGVVQDKSLRIDRRTRAKKRERPKTHNKRHMDATTKKSPVSPCSDASPLRVFCPPNPR